MSSSAVSAIPTNTSPTTTPSVSSSSSSSSETASKPKPCCVCKPEKTARDDCMLFSKSDDPAQMECRSLVEKYKSCMAGFGFKI
ncbi:hypothetical protein FQN50_001712 [Emmonsiellopsis sp. PD_5]|nr:hypothetical protein FQN50_001712 [Emmonsiellopsis sp. PD_5]